jgi:hypothetical protein
MSTWPYRAVPFLCLALIRAAAGQAAAGRVVRATSGAPIGGVTVALLDGRTLLAAKRTDDSGHFDLSAPKTGTFTLKFTLIGFTPLTTTVRLADGIPTPTVYRLSELPVSMDTIVAKAAATAGPGSVFYVTPGREIYRQHALLNQGQMVSGLEIQRSKMSAVEYLGTLAGFRFVSSVAGVAPRSSEPSSPPTIPGKNGYLISTYGDKCLYGRIDRWSIIGLLDQHNAGDVDELISADDIMAVELYRNIQEVPDDFRGPAAVRNLVWRTVIDGRNYLIGDTGLPHFPRYSVDANPRDGPGRSISINPRMVTAVRQPGGGASQRPDSLLVDTLSTPPSFDLPTMLMPSCGFVQIWTRVAW